MDTQKPVKDSTQGFTGKPVAAETAKVGVADTNQRKPATKNDK